MKALSCHCQSRMRCNSSDSVNKALTLDHHPESANICRNKR